MKTFYLLATILLLAGCGKSKNTFTLFGTIKGINDSIAWVIIPDTAFSRIDTVSIKDEKFEYQLQTDTTVLLTLMFKNGTQYDIFADKNTQTEISGDTAHWNSLQVKGGTYNDILYPLMDRYRKINAEQARDSVKTFIAQNPFSPVSVYLLDKYYVQTPNPDAKTIQELIKLMSGKLQDDFLIRDIEERLKYSAMADTGRYISNFRTKNKDNKYISAYQYNNQYIVVTFWASWLPDGMKLQKEIAEAKKDKKREKTVFLNIAMDTDKKTWNELMKNDSLPAEQTCDLMGWKSRLVEQFGVNSIPQIILLNKQRKVVARENRLEPVIAKLDSLLENDKKNKK